MKTMRTYKVVNPEGYGLSTDQKIAASIERYGVKCKITGGGYAGYGFPEYSIIQTNEPFNSEFMQSIAFNTKVTEL